MSYCRNSGKDSNVYVIGTIAGLECCGCSLYKGSFVTRRYSTMIAHLKEHRKKADKVPAHAFARLAAEKRSRHNRYPTRSSQRLSKNVRKTKNEICEQKLYREMAHHREGMAETAIEVFEDIYGRKPNLLELPGLAEAAEIIWELRFTHLQSGREGR